MSHTSKRWFNIEILHRNTYKIANTHNIHHHHSERTLHVTHNIVKIVLESCSLTYNINMATGRILSINEITLIVSGFLSGEAREV